MRLTSALLIAAIIAPGALACKKIIPTVGYIPGLESGPCTGACTSYKVCPQGVQCAGGYFWGAWSCTNGTVTLPGVNFIDGYSNLDGCCILGRPSGALGTCTVPTAAVGSFGCGLWIL